MPPENVVRRNLRRTPSAQLHQLSALGVATIHEAQGRTGLLAPYMRPIYPGAKAAGSALTVLGHPGDNTMLHVAADVCREGDVIVLALSAENSDGMIGELLATSYRARGGLGAILDAGCRDVAELTRMQFPVWSKAISAKGTVKGAVGSVNIPVVCAGALVHPGDAIVADDDGVVVVPREQVAEVIELARQREQREAAVRERLAKGELGLDIYGLRSKLETLGLRYEDSADAGEIS